MNPPPDSSVEHGTDNFTLPWAAIAFLILTATLSLLWSHHKLLSQDEIFVLQTDSVPNYAQLIHIQRSYPISLDPFVYHTLAHIAIKIFGAGAFALRIPSLFGYLLMQLCLFFFVRRIANEHAALFAMAFPAVTATLLYSTEGRPYGLLLGFYGLAMLSWQTATRRQSHRTGSLVVLALAVALTLNTHYFGVLLLIPLCAAELFRTIQRRRLDVPVAAAIAIGMACIAFALPFERSAAEFRNNYYNVGQVNYHTITVAYRSLFLDYTAATLNLQHLVAIALVIFAALLVFGVLRQLRSEDLHLPKAELVFVVLLAALPFFGFLLAQFVTHSIEVRYVLGTILAISILLAIALLPLLRRPGAAVYVLSSLAVAIFVSSSIRIHTTRAKTREFMVSLILSPRIKAAILSSPSGLLYLQEMGTFEVASYYEPDPDLRSRMALVYSTRQELLWSRRDTESLTALHMRNFTGFPIVSYEKLSTETGDHVFVLLHSGWDWTDQALAAANAEITPLGPAIEGDAASIRFTAQPQPKAPK